MNLATTRETFEEKYAKEIELLTQGHDYLIRERVSGYIEEVIAKSDMGDIGWSDFVSEIRLLINAMEVVCKEYYHE